MTVEEIIQEIRNLSLSERKQIIHVIVDTLTETEKNIHKERIPGLHARTSWVSDDFDDELPDSFWLGDE